MKWILITKKNLKKIDANIQTGSGIIDSLVISDVASTFYNFPNSYHTEITNRILIPLPKLYKPNFQFSVYTSSSILGLDILKRYKIQFPDDAVYLEKYLSNRFLYYFVSDSDFTEPL